MLREKQAPYIQDNDEEMREFCNQHATSRVIIRKGQEVPPSEPDCTGFLDKGRVKIYMSSDVGEERLMWFLLEGSLMPFGNDKFYMKRAVADEDSEIIYVTIDDIYTFAMQSKKNMYSMIEQRDSRYNLCLQAILERQTESSPLKLYHFLLNMTQLYGQETADGILLETLPSRNDIASFLGIHRSNVTRYLSDLEQAGILVKINKGILLKDQERLEELIEAEREEE